MKITKIEKKKRLYLLGLDQDQQLYITEDTIVRFMLSKDKEITAEELTEIQSYAQFSYGKNLALYHLSFKQRTTKEVRDYLTKHEIDETIREQVIDNLLADNWLNDRKYAETFIQSNLLSGDKGAYVLKQKLSQKGIAASILEELLQDTDFSSLAQKAAQKLLKKYENRLPQKALQDKIIQNLINKGFSYSEAKEAFQHLNIEQDEEEQEALLFKELDKQYQKYSRKYQGYELKQRLTQALARKGYDFSDIASALREYF
ncbi:recombination regulator RecX [Streptococcus massiliensis]|uniref:Regulatory protein RecX n=1 Tax=Streptococcus massiliensis TaxID=313439 RepID=A0A380L1X9_9STRE|nr:recombination regulator RecX [Streptococcus massiliensis]SUN77375.1 recombination regulator RecX [Streptococcus massiliensis]